MTDFRGLLDRHWPTLRRLGLATDTPEQLFVSDADGQPTIVSIFGWANAEAVDQAHHHPEVAEIWEAMGPLCEQRDGPAMEFPHFQSMLLAR